MTLNLSPYDDRYPGITGGRGIGREATCVADLFTIFILIFM